MHAIEPLASNFSELENGAVKSVLTLVPKLAKNSRIVSILISCFNAEFNFAFPLADLADFEKLSSLSTIPSPSKASAMAEFTSIYSLIGN